jgi:hypothetical protein
MKNRTYYRRNDAEIELDKAIEINYWRQGYPIREIAAMMELERKYKVSYVTIQRDIAEVIKEAKELRAKAGINDLDDIIDKYEHIYNEACILARTTPHPGYLANANKSQENIAKLKGLQVDKTEISFKYIIDIE